MKTSLIIALLLIVFSTKAQIPQSFKYQAVVRNNTGEVLKNQMVGLQFTIRKDSTNGAVAYKETITSTSNAAGLINLEIGKGTAVIGSFANIKWETGTYFLETSIDYTGGTSFQLLGTTQLLSVPFALYSQTANRAPTKTKSERGLISNPFTGQLIFCTDCGSNGELQIFNGTNWTNMIGDPVVE